MMYYRQFNGLDDVNEVQRTQFLERSGQLWQNSRSDEGRYESEGYFMANLNGEFTQSMDVESDIKRISFVSKANHMFRSAGPQNAFSQTTIVMDKSKKSSSHYNQNPGLPKWSTKSPKVLAIGTGSPQTKKEAELESAVTILQAKLEYTERKVAESENNKELLKARLDKLIFQLTQAGFDPNLKAAPPTKQISRQAPRQPPKMEEVKVKAMQPSEPLIKAVLVPFGTSRPAKVSEESWEKLLSLANEYEQRLNMVKSLEEQEKQVKQQMTAPRNLSMADAMELQHPALPDRR